MDPIEAGKAAVPRPHPVHTMMSFPIAPDNEAEQIGMAPESSSKTKEHSLGEWERQRGRITNLSLTHKKTLRQVMDLMESTYGFIATERQYKRKFAKWGLDTKNIRDHDMRLVLAKDVKRKREGKDTEFEINGRLLPRQKMQRFMLRKELSEEDVIRSDAATPPYVTYHTPHPVEYGDLADALPSTSLGKDEVMTDECASHDQGTENLFDCSTIVWLDKQHEERASTLVSNLSFSDEVSEDTRKILERNKAWLEKRCKARNDLRLLHAYARPTRTRKKQRPTTLQEGLSIWESHLESLLETYHSDYVPSWDYDELLLKTRSNAPVSRIDSIRDNICEEPSRGLQLIPAASPFERWSQRYDISSSPNWIKSYMSPSNPLLLLTPAPTGSPWDHIPKASPRLIGSEGYGSRAVDRLNGLFSTIFKPN